MALTSLVPTTSSQPRAATQPASIPVLPAVDLNLGTVTFQTPNGHRIYWTPEPAQLVRALSEAVRPAQWIPAIGTLVITVAQTGIRAGRGRGFRLSAH